MEALPKQTTQATLASRDANNSWWLIPPITDTIRFTYGLAALISLIGGFFFNSLLMHLIKTKTVHAMKIYSRLLLQSCVMDMLIAVTTFLVQPIPIVDHGYRMVFHNGVFRNVPQPYGYMLYVLWIQLMLFFLVSITTQFIFRYCLLTRNGRIPYRLVTLTIGIAFVLNVAHIALLTWSDYPREENANELIEMEHKIWDEAGITNAKFFTIVKARSFRWLCHCSIMVILFSSCYAIITITSLKIRQHFKVLGNKFARVRLGGENSVKIHEYNNQITMALLAQVLQTNPTRQSNLVNFVQILLPIFFDNKTIFIIVYTPVPLYLVPVLSPLATILLVKPFRRAMFDYVKKSTQLFSTPLTMVKRISHSSFRTINALPRQWAARDQVEPTGTILYDYNLQRNIPSQSFGRTTTAQGRRYANY